MAVSTALQEKREKFHEKQKLLASVFEKGRDGDRYDFGRKDVLELLGAADQAEATQKVKALNVELGHLGEELRQAELAEIESDMGDREKERNVPIRRPEHPASPNGEYKTWGQLFAESEEFKNSKRTKTDHPLVLEIGMKTLFQTTAGFAPESIRSGLLVEDETRPIQVLDLIPTFPISQASFVYMEETTRTHAAAEKAEGTAYPESTFVWTEKTSTVQKVADSIPVTDEQLEDEQQVRSLLDQRLTFGLRQRLDSQVLVGSGTSPNLRGINNVTGIQTQALGTDDRITAFAKALTLIRFTGRSVPSGAVFHPNDWQDILLLKNINGDFLFGNPFMSGGPMSLLGIPVVQSDAQTQNTGLVGDFRNFSRLDDRRGVQVQTGFVGTQFTDGKVTIRADLRAAFTVTRPAAFCQITGI